MVGVFGTSRQVTAAKAGERGKRVAIDLDQAASEEARGVAADFGERRQVPIHSRCLRRALGLDLTDRVDDGVKG